MLPHQVTKSNTNPDELGGLANQLTTEFGDLASEAKCAAITAENDEVTNNTVSLLMAPLEFTSVFSVYFCLSKHLQPHCACWCMYVCNKVIIILPALLQIGSHIKKQVTELGYSCTGLVTKAGALQCSPSDSITKKELIDAARKVSEKVSEVFPCSLILHQIIVVGCLTELTRNS